MVNITSKKYSSRYKLKNWRSSLIVAAILMLTLLVGSFVSGNSPVGNFSNTKSAPETSSTPPLIKYSGQSAANGQPIKSGNGTEANAGSPATTNSSSSTVISSPPSDVGPAPKPQQVPPPQPEGSSGIAGRIYLMFGCTPPKMCPEVIRPYQATVQVETAGGKAVTSFTSASDGSFSVILAPGTYLMVPQLYDNGNITASTQTVTVVQGRYTQVTISYRQQI